MRTRMHLWLTGLALAGLALPVGAMMIAPPPLPLRVAAADLTVIGKVTALGKLEPADMHKGDTRQMQIALVQVERVLDGKAGKQIRVGFFPPPAQAPAQPGRPVLLRRWRMVQLSVGQEGILLLTKHPTRDCYTVSAYGDVINKAGNPAFPKSVDEIVNSAKLLAEAQKGLKAKDVQERFTTAALLVSRYRTVKPGGKTVLVPAAESKQILLALAEADWAPQPGRSALTPQTVFYRLNLTAKDGWMPPKDFRDFPAAAKKWLKDNAGAYQIPRYTVEKPIPVEPSEK